MSKKGSVLKKVLLGFGVLVICIGTVFYFGLRSRLNEFAKEISMIEVKNIDVSNLSDGEYIGEYDHNPLVGATVKVFVENNRIVDIEMIEHRAGKGKKAEEIVNNVIAQQSLEVDSISGATGSSVIILKAIENALK